MVLMMVSLVKQRRQQRLLMASAIILSVCNFGDDGRDDPARHGIRWTRIEVTGSRHDWRE